MDEHSQSAQLRSEAEEATANGHLERAADVWRTVTELSPLDTSGWLGLINTLSRMNRHAEADQVAEIAMERLPDDFWISRAHAELPTKQKSQKPLEALRRWQALTNRFPNSALAHVGKARTLLQLGQLGSALESANTAVEVEPTNFWGLHCLGDLLEKAGKTNEALDLWRSVCEHFPQEWLGWPRYFDLLLRQGRHEEAARVVAKGLALHPNNPDICFSAVEAARQSSQLQDALKAWRHLRSLYTVDPPHFLHVTENLHRAFCPHPDSDEFLVALLCQRMEADPASAPRAPVYLFQSTMDRSILITCLQRALSRIDPKVLDLDVRIGVAYLTDEVLPADLLRRHLHKHVVKTSVTHADMVMLSFAFTEDAASAARAREVLGQHVDVLLEQVANDSDLLLSKADECLALAKLCDRLNRDAGRRLAAAIAAVLQKPETPLNVSEAVSFVSHNLLGASRSAPAIGSLPRRLKIVLEVSGQLRGFQKAFESWGAFGFDGHDTTTVVHTWSHSGRKTPHDAQGAARSFGGKFLLTYTDALARRGYDIVRSTYPHLIRAVLDGSQVTKDELCDFYKTGHVILENDEALPYAAMNNPEKMYYKIGAAHHIARTAEPDAHLYVRIRPDLMVTRSNEADWVRLYHRSYAENVIYADNIRCLRASFGMVMGDQFAIGATTGMDAYASALASTYAAAKGSYYGFPSVPKPHLNVAYATFFRGVGVELQNAVNFVGLCNPQLLSPVQLMQEVHKDIAMRPPDHLDQTFVKALAEDIFGTKPWSEVSLTTG